jgi:molecular chaperone HtpG
VQFTGLKASLNGPNCAAGIYPFFIEETMSKETLGFQAEVKQLMQLMIHSLYSNKEIFLRELVSNASDAVDKLRYAGLSDGKLLEDAGELGVKVSFDQAARTITIADNGIGMSRDEVIANIGTIAKSGTKEFFSKLTGDQAKDSNLIGQFGVGFYSSFIVASKVSLVSREAGEAAATATRWESAGEGDYTLEATSKDAPGTTITLHLREGEDDFLSGWRLKELIKRYSDHLTLPVFMLKETWDDEKKDMVTTDEWERANSAMALWQRPKSELTDEQYNAFYKSLTHDFDAPLARSHNKVEGNREYTQLLFIPSKAPFDLYERDRMSGVKLYVRRVFIMDDAKHLLPQYLRFVRGVVDSNDLPLNVSREILQESKDVSALKSGNVKRVLTMIEDLAENDKEKFATFWKAFGNCFKEGAGEDFENRERVQKLLRFASTHADAAEQSVSLADYVARMKPEQEKIYFVTADSYTAGKSSPHLEVFRKKGVEVLILADRVDEWMVSHLTEFDGKQLASVAKGALDLGKLETEEEKKAAEAQNEAMKPLIERVKTALGDKVKEVRVTHRLTDSPACLVVAEHEMSGNLERLMKRAGQTASQVKPSLELNPTHPLIERLQKVDDAQFGDWAEVVYGQALLAEGGVLESPGDFVRKLNGLMLAIAK